MALNRVVEAFYINNYMNEKFHVRFRLFTCLPAPANCKKADK